MKRWWDLHLKCVIGLKDIQFWGMEVEEEKDGFKYLKIPTDLKTIKLHQSSN